MREPSHGPESLAEKTKWFATLTVQERLEYLEFMTELALHFHPECAQKRHDPSSPRRVVSPQ